MRKEFVTGLLVCMGDATKRMGLALVILAILGPTVIF